MAPGQRDEAHLPRAPPPASPNYGGRGPGSLDGPMAVSSTRLEIRDRCLPLGARREWAGLLAQTQLSPKVLTRHFLQNSPKFSSFEPFVASIQVHYFKNQLISLLPIILKM